MSILANPLDFICYELCPGCADVYQLASAFLRHKCARPSTKVEQRKQVLEKMVARELKRARKTKPVNLKCLQLRKRKRKEDAGTEPNQKTNRRNQTGLLRELTLQAAADDTSTPKSSNNALPTEGRGPVKLGAPSNGIAALQESFHFASSIQTSYDGNELDGAYFTNFNDASYDGNELNGIYFTNSNNASYNGNELDGAYFTNFNHASYDGNELEGPILQIPRAPSALNSSNPHSYTGTHSGRPEESVAGVDKMDFPRP